MRKIAPLAFAALAIALTFSSTADAVALGNIASQSSFGQPLRVVIPVAIAGAETVSSACVRLVSVGSAEGTPQLLAGRIDLDRGPGGPRLVVTTTRPVTEPTMRLSVQAGCDNTIRRDYVLLLDPPEARQPATLASADTDEFARYARSTRPAAAASTPRANPVVASASSIAAKVMTVAAVTAPTSLVGVSPDAARNTAPAPIAPEPIKAETTGPTSAPATSVPRGLVTLVADNGTGGGLIAQASAHSLPRVTSTLPRSPVQAADAAWTGNWLYVAAGLATIILGLTAFSLRRHAFRPPVWASSADRGESLNLNTLAAVTDMFAHFSSMKESAPITPRATQNVTAMDVPSTEDGSVDTLFGAINADVIDEQVVRDAWKTAASEHATDLGSDSILKAIAAAERDMQIAPPSAIDRSLDEDLFRDLPRRLASRS